MVTVTMPRLSDTMEEGIVARWIVADGERVERGEELVEIETDKATAAHEAEASGVVRHAVAEGEITALGATICWIGEPAELATLLPARAADASAAAQPPARTSPAAVPVPAKTRATPVARRMAAEHGIELATVAGSGPNGRIGRKDIEALIAAPGAVGSVVLEAAASPPGSPNGRDIVPFTRVQQVIARRMAEAHATIPDFAVDFAVEMDAVLLLREQMRAARDERPPSLNDFVVRAAALALREHPRINASLREDGVELHSRVNVGVAVAAEEALLVPTVFDADRKSLLDIARETAALAERARAGQGTLAEFADGTFTVSNLGMYGALSCTPVVNPPQAAILGVGAARATPIVRDGELAAGRVAVLRLSCDHRIVYGADAAAFLAMVKDKLEAPLALLV